ncbi:trichohyalin-like [Gouania willdenowi]|uniref:trichohyalin-like n=1 Tax=Gouania willdenowi TaxID=441366 RepID=UPI0010550A2C|nr:trichohyalin-like [Gouania willdenowi]
MALCLVPEFPGVTVALERLKELDEGLTEHGAPPEAHRHLALISAAVSDLEAERRAAHELLDVETNENSELRHKIQQLSEKTSHDLQSGVAAVWESNSAEIEKLREELGVASKLHQEATARHDELLQQNQAMCAEIERAKAEQDTLNASLEEEISLKTTLQEKLLETQRLTEEVESSIAAVEHHKVTLQQKMTLERNAFNAEKESLSKEEEKMEEKIKKQEEVIRMRRSELEKVNQRKEEAQRSLNDLSAQAAKLENNVEKLRTSLSQHEKRVQEETQMHQELEKQRERLEKKPQELDEAFRIAVTKLQEESVTAESEMEEDRVTSRALQEKITHIQQVHKHQREEEEKTRAEVTVVSQQLERSTLQLEERITSIIRYRQQIKEMEKRTRELQEKDAINRRLFQKNQEELRGNLETEWRLVLQLEDEMEQLHQQLEQLRTTQQEHEEQMNSSIGVMRRRYQELQREEAALLQRQPKSVDLELLRKHVLQSETESRQVENRRQKELQENREEMENLVRSIQEKQRELEQKMVLLRQEEEMCEEKLNRNQSLMKLHQELERNKCELEDSIHDLEKKTSSLLKSREKLKLDLQELQERHMETLFLQTSALRAEEVQLYSSRTSLEQVQMENSRFYLAIRRMTEEVHRARRDRDGYLQDTQVLRHDTEALREALQEKWREDAEVTQEQESRMEELLYSTTSLMELLQSRGTQVGKISALLHQHLMEFNRRLGGPDIKGQS